MLWKSNMIITPLDSSIWDGYDDSQRMRYVSVIDFLDYVTLSEKHKKDCVYNDNIDSYYKFAGRWHRVNGIKIDDMIFYEYHTMLKTFVRWRKSILIPEFKMTSHTKFICSTNKEINFTKLKLML